jgi:CBS domain containing-hemolysin-like protein
MGTTVLILVLTLAMIGINALYVAAEFAAVSARRPRIMQQAAEGNRLARMLSPILNNPHKLDTYVAACQIGITVSSLVLGYYGQSAISAALAPLLVGLGGLQEAAATSIAIIVVLVLLTALQMLLGELVPKSIAVRYPERLALLTVVPMRWSTVLFGPFIALFNGAGGLILRLLRVPPAEHHGHVHSPEEIDLLIGESAKGGILDADERLLLRNALRIGRITASEVMVPRTRLVAAPLTISVRELLQLATTTGYSRIPLYEDSVDAIKGMVHVKDAYRLVVAGEEKIDAVVRQVPFVPEVIAAVDVWNRLRRSHSYVAIVFDEFGGTAGMITLEDLIEEIFGELQDEVDREPDMITPGADGSTRLHGEMLVEDVNELLGIKLPTDIANTIGGLLFNELGHRPEVGEEVMLAGCRLRVETINGLAVREVAVYPPPATEKHDDEEGAW